MAASPAAAPPAPPLQRPPTEALLRAYKIWGYDCVRFWGVRFPGLTTWKFGKLADTCEPKTGHRRAQSSGPRIPRMPRKVPASSRIPELVPELFVSCRRCFRALHQSHAHSTAHSGAHLFMQVLDAAPNRLSELQVSGALFGSLAPCSSIATLCASCPVGGHRGHRPNLLRFDRCLGPGQRRRGTAKTVRC